MRGANVMMPPATAEDLHILRSWGANLAEIAFEDVYEAEPPYGFLPDQLARVDDLVEAAEATGLYVVLTCRRGPGRGDFDQSFEIWQDEVAQAAYIAMWRQLAEHYRDRQSIVGYDLICEPHPGQYEVEPLGGWNALARRITAAIREVDPQTPILVNSTGYGYPHKFADLKPTGDQRTVYVVHMYSPRHYTSQRPDVPVVYPGVVAAHAEPEQYWDKHTIEKTLAFVRDFEKRYHAPIFAGEFGCYRWAPGVEQYLGDLLELFEAYGWSWAYWAFRESDGLDIERSSNAVDRARHPETPLLVLFRSYFERNERFLSVGTQN